MKNRLFTTILCLFICLPLISCGSSSKMHTLDDVDASVFTLHCYDEKEMNIVPEVDLRSLTKPQ